jgi:hypothetical protein
MVLKNLAICIIIKEDSLVPVSRKSAKFRLQIDHKRWEGFHGLKNLAICIKEDS